MEANKPIASVFKALAKTKFGASELIGASTAASLVSSEKGVIGGLSSWAFGKGTSTMQKVVRGGMLYGGVSAAGRIASGGGLYRDRNGRFNVIGVPFV